MILSDKTLRKYVLEDIIPISPMPKDDQFQPSSIDLRLDYNFIKYKDEIIGLVDTKNSHLDLSNYVDKIKLKYRHDPYILQPNSFVLAQTIESVTIPDNLVGVIEGRSSFGRLGILVHSTAGYIDPGFEGNITLEIKNMNTFPIAIYPEQRICQIVFHELNDVAEAPYGSNGLKSKYQYQTMPTPSKIMEEY